MHDVLRTLFHRCQSYRGTISPRTSPGQFGAMHDVLGTLFRHRSAIAASTGPDALTAIREKLAGRLQLLCIYA